MLSFDIQNILILLSGFAGIIYGLVIYSGNKKSKINLWFFLFVSFVAFWCISMFFYRSMGDINNAIIWARILYFSAASTPVFFLGFSYIFPEDKPFLKSWKNYLIFIPFIFITIISLLPDTLIKNVNIIPGYEKEIIFNSINYYLYILYINIYFGWSYVILITKYFKYSGSNIIKTQLSYIIVGTIVSTIIGMFTNLFLPTFGIFAFNWVGQVGIIVMLTTIFYAILKHHLFDIKVATTEALTFAVWIVLLIQFILAKTIQEKIIGLVLLIFVGVFSFLLIKSVIKEVRLREHIEILAKNLEKANARLQELDKLKSEFVSFATHQIRAPLTAIKGYISLIQEGSFGHISDKVKNALDKIFQSSQSLVLVVEDYLDISRIEMGSMKYEFAVKDFSKIVKETAEELTPNIKKAGLKLNIKIDETKEYKANVDEGKIRQVIINIIDNAIKYTKKGSINIFLSRNEKERKILLKVADTGMGISKKTMPKLFSKFIRAKNANEVNIKGTGLGLYIAREITKAHSGGKLWAESQGEGKGSQFYVEVDSAK